MIVESTIQIFDLKMQEVLGIEKKMAVAISFFLEDVTAVRENVEEGEDEIDPDKSIIYLKSGEYFVISTPYKWILEQLKLKEDKQ